MSQKLLTTFAIFIFVLLLVTGLWALTVYFENLPENISQHETLVFGQDRLVPGSQAGLRVVVRDSQTTLPLPEAQIKVSLRPEEGGPAVPLFSGETDGLGTANISFKVPDGAAGNQKLIVETKSRLGSDRLEQPVSLQRDFRILLTTDKPLYQPGQLIQVRALALSTFDLKPAASQDLEFVIADGKGNKVFRKKVTTSEFGVASAGFQLASEVNTGPYKITAVMGNTSSEKTVTVEHYVLPKFAVDLTTERTFYLPGSHVKGSLDANYFFGKPVSGGEVLLEGFTFDVERSVAVTLQGATDDAGHFEFEFDLPAYLTGSELDGRMGRFYLQATVTDGAEHSEVSNLSLPVARDSIIVEAVPEGGQFRPGVENILYVLTGYPDGSPAETDLVIQFFDGSEPLAVHTGPFGLAEVWLTPNNAWQQFLIQAHDAQGNQGQREFSFEGEYSEETVLLRPDKPVYRVGETGILTLLTSQPEGPVFLDIVREGQTVSTRSVEISGGRAEVALDLTPDLFGTLELHAYKVLTSGSIARDTRLIVVDNAADLSVTLHPGQETYRPGDTAGLDLQVSGAGGSRAQSAVGLAIVDESVFALAEQDPGFAKLYFMLEQELLKPKFDLHGLSIPQLVEGVPVSSDAVVGAIEDTAQASLSAATGRALPWKIANSRLENLQQAYTRQGKYFTNLSKGLYGVILLIPLAVFGLTLGSIWREKRLSQSLALAFGLAILAGLAFLLWPLGDNQAWAQTPVERLGVMLEWANEERAEVVLSLALLGFCGWAALAGLAWRRGDAGLGLSVGLLPLMPLALGGLVFATTRTTISPDTAILMWGLLALGLLPFAFLLRFACYASGRQYLPALAALLVVVFMLGGALPALAMGTRSAMISSQAGRNAMDGGPMIVEEAMDWAAGPMAAMPAAMPPAEKDAPASGEVEAPAQPSAPEANAAEPPRLRQYFPETMLWLPDAVTDENGFLHLDVPVADSITTWRMTALASSQDGRLGSVTTGLRVFQDFFIDLDLPLALTVGDEISVPVGVFNYLAEEQAVQLELEQSDWFELLDEPVKEISIASNDISVVYFRVRALRFGSQPFKVTALGAQMSDAIQKEVRVFPDGKQVTFTQSDRLTPGTPVRQAVAIPADAMAGTQSLVVKIYPGVLSQVVEGLDSILRMPFGCFEQTSSTTYPNVLVLDYLKSTSQTSPETQLKAEEYINLGYQRLATFEVDGSGGFSLFGDPPADRMLTAYGLQEFGDMSRVHDVDPALIQRAAEWLLSQQKGDGSWENDQGLVHENTWSSLGNDRLPVTAYIVWSLVDGGFGDDPRTQQGLEYVREFQAQAEDAYVVALVANALVSADRQAGGNLNDATVAVLDRLAGLAAQEGSGAYWKSGVATFMGSEGQTGSIETTALAALALLRADRQPELANAALTYLIRQKDGFGTWHSTQATVLALKSLIESVRAGDEKVEATVTVSLNGGQTRTVQVNSENYDVVQLLSFDDLNPAEENWIDISVEGAGNLMYQIAGSYYLPWEKLELYPELQGGDELVTIGVAYDRTELAVNDTVGVDVTVTLNEPGALAESALIDLGLPPGFTALGEDLEALVIRYDDVPADYALPTIERYELTGRQILVYASNLSADHPLQFSYRLRAKFPLVAQTPASSAYDYYNPQVTGETVPQTLVVNP